MDNLFQINSSPNLKTHDNTAVIMSDVLKALVPALIMSCIFFGLRSLFITLVSVLSCVLFEYLLGLILKKNTIKDLSAAVTGVLLAYTLPPTTPYWMVVIGAFFAIVFVKGVFGGLGNNFINPALAARAFLFFSWPDVMTTWAEPFSKINLLVSDPAQIVTGATPLAVLKTHEGTKAAQSLFQMFLGETGGCIGEVSALMLILGGLFLLYRKVITWHIPVAYIGTVAVMTYIFPFGYERLYFMTANILSGGLILGAIFMATDYSTSPLTSKGKIIYGIGCGLLTVLFRFFGGFPEGVCFSILIMNCLVWFIDKFTKPRRYGTGGGAVNV